MKHDEVYIIEMYNERKDRWEACADACIDKVRAVKQLRQEWLQGRKNNGNEYRIHKYKRIGDVK